MQIVPVGLRLHPEPFDGDELTLDSEQPLDDALRLLVPSFPKLVVADDAVRVDEVERRPVVVVERAPDPVVAVERDRVVDVHVLRRLPDAVDLVLERELRGVDADHDQSVISIRARQARTDGSVRSQLMHVNVQKSTTTDVTAELGGAKWLGVEPLGRPAERGHVETFEHGHLANRPERGAHFLGEELRLFPRGEVGRLCRPR